MNDLEEGMARLTTETSKLNSSIQALSGSLQLYSEATKHREAISIAVTDALTRVSKRRYDAAILAVAMLSAIAAICAAIGIFH